MATRRHVLLWHSQAATSSHFIITINDINTVIAWWFMPKSSFTWLYQTIWRLFGVGMLPWCQQHTVKSSAVQWYQCWCAITNRTVMTLMFYRKYKKQQRKNERRANCWTNSQVKWFGTTWHSCDVTLKRNHCLGICYFVSPSGDMGFVGTTILEKQTNKTKKPK